MGLAQEFLDLMPLTIQVQHQSSINAYNEATYTAPVEYQARLEPTYRLLRSHREQAVPDAIQSAATKTPVGVIVVTFPPKTVPVET